MSSPRGVKVVRHHHKHNLKHRFELVKTLGQGTYGKVKLAIERSSGVQYAIKSIKKNKIENEQDLARIRREIEIMATLNHPHIISVYEVFENDEKIILVMEYAEGGELYDYINEKKGLGEREARKFFRQIVSAINYLHQNAIVHRDLKLENIVLDCHNDVRIADFGLSNLYGGDKLLSTFCGSPLYASPEIVNGHPYKGPEVDCWSLGVLLYTMVYGAMPFDGSDFKILRSQISTGNYHEPVHPSDAAGLIRHLLTVDPEERATIDDICHHWWTNIGYSSTPLEYESYTFSSCDDSQENTQSDGDSDSNNERLGLPRRKPLKSILKKPKKKSILKNASQNEWEGDNRETNKKLFQKGFCASLSPTHHNKENCDAIDTKSKQNDSKNQAFPEDDDFPSYKEIGIDKKELDYSYSPVSSPDKVEVNIFDSSKKPKRGILKNKKQPAAVEMDCDHVNIPSIEVCDKELVKEVEIEDSPLKEELSLEKEESLGNVADDDEEDTYNLSDIETVLDEINQDLEKLELKATENEENLSTEFTDKPLLEQVDSWLSYDVPRRPPKSPLCNLETGTPTFKSASTPRRIKGILKRNSKYGLQDPTNRYSFGSQGSNSSTDLLDFSYDSIEGEEFMVRNCTLFNETQLSTASEGPWTTPELESLSLESNPSLNGKAAVDSVKEQVQLESKSINPSLKLPHSLGTSDKHQNNLQEKLSTQEILDKINLLSDESSTFELIEKISALDEKKDRDEHLCSDASVNLFDLAEAQDVYRQAMEICTKLT